MKFRRVGVNKGLVVYLDGKFVPKNEAKISVWDHGFLYGDGVFEGIRCYNGRVFRLEQHLNRLYDSAKSIHLNIPLTKEDMREKVIETFKINGFQDSYCRLVVSRGPGDLGLDPRKCSKATVVILVDKIQLYPEELYKKGMKLIIASTRKNIPEALNPKIKSLNYLNNILAKMEANLAGAGEAVMVNQQGYVAECSADNLFIVKDGVLITPPVYVGALEGITRNVVIELALANMVPFKEALFGSHDLFTADECFLTGTGAELIAAVEINGRILGDGTPGPITIKLLKEFRELIKHEGAPVFQVDAKCKQLDKVTL